MTEGSLSRWGRVSDDGTVFVRTADGERPVGDWHAGTPAEGLAHYERRYDDLAAEIGLLEKRVDTGAADPRGVLASAERLRSGLSTAAAVGDLDALDARLGTLADHARERVAQGDVEREQRKQESVVRKQALVDEAVALARSSDWKAAGDRFRTLSDEWRSITGVDRRTDSGLWKQVAAAREEFTRRRTAHFAALQEQRSTSRARKEKILVEAEKLVDSTDWVATAGRFRSLMGEWKSAGRAARDVDDALWTRFKAAQDGFFARRTAVNAERDAQFRTNQARKEELLAEAEALDPDADLAGSRRRLRAIQEKWEEVGKVPREAMGTLEKRLAGVEARIRSAGDTRRRPVAVESPLVIRLRESVGKLEARIAKARAEGRTDALAELEGTLGTQREWLRQAESSAGRV